MDINTNIEEIEAPTFTGDEADQASAIETYQRNLVISQILAKSQKELPHDFDGCCVECGVEIPPFRLEKLKSTLCVDCQTIAEKKARR